MTVANPAVVAVTSTAATTTLACQASKLRLVHCAGTDVVWWRTDGSTAVIATTGSYPLLPGGVVEGIVPADVTAPAVNLVSTGSTTVSVQKDTNS